MRPGRQQQRNHADYDQNHAGVNGQPVQLLGPLGMRRLIKRAEKADHAEPEGLEGERRADPCERGPVEGERRPEGGERRAFACECDSGIGGLCLGHGDLWNAADWIR